MGTRRRNDGDRTGADVRPGLAVDGQRLCAPPRLRAGRRRGGRIQRQVHGRPDGAQGWRLRHPGRAHAPILPQFLLSPSALDVRRCPAGAERGRTLRARGVSGRRDRRPLGGPQSSARQVVLRRSRLGIVRGHLRPARILSHPPGDGPFETGRARNRRLYSTRRDPGGVRQRGQPENPPAAGRGAPDRDLCAGRYQRNGPERRRQIHFKGLSQADRDA